MTSSSEKIHYSLGFLLGARNLTNVKNCIKVSVKHSNIVQEVSKCLNELGVKTYINKYFNSINLFLGADNNFSNEKQEIDPILNAYIKNQVPVSKEEADSISFIRGMFEVNYMYKVGSKISITLTSSQEELVLSNIEAKPISKDGNELTWQQEDKLDFLHSIYGDSDFHSMYLYEMYEKSRIEVSHFNNTSRNLPQFAFSKTREDAVAPFKSRPSDSGFDLTLLDISKKMGNVEMYSTGIIVKPTLGWYFLLAPRSSIIKSGYMLANGVGIIDRSYRGEIKVPLIKVDENAPDLILPSRLVQIVPQPIIDFDFKETDFNSIGNSSRGEKGFGSSNGN